jgi:hypothetical protein
MAKQESLEIYSEVHNGVRPLSIVQETAHRRLRAQTQPGRPRELESGSRFFPRCGLLEKIGSVYGEVRFYLRPTQSLSISSRLVRGMWIDIQLPTRP